MCAPLVLPEVYLNVTLFISVIPIDLSAVMRHLKEVSQCTNNKPQQKINNSKSQTTTIV